MNRIRTGEPMTAARVAAMAVLVTIAGLCLTACGPSDPPDSTPSSATGTATSEPTTNTGSPAPNQQSPSPTSSAPQEDEMRIEISINGQRFQATLGDSAASRDLIAQLPLTLDMSDHGGVEKTGALPSELSLDGQPPGADPDIGDVGYYAPGNDLVLYYGDQSYYDGIVVLGQMEGDAAQRIAHMEGTVTVSVHHLDG
jgi:hypothetical protein